MKKIIINLMALALLAVGSVKAETYSYSGKNYDNVIAPYTTDMQVTGSITTSIPIPPNSSGFDIRTIVTSWSFFDGVHTITNADGEFHTLYTPKVTTDGTGKILSANVWVNFGTTASEVNQTQQYIATQAAGGFDHGVQLAKCTQVSGGACSHYLFGPRGFILGAPGPWTIVEPVREFPGTFPSGATGTISFTTDDPGCTFDTDPQFITVASVGVPPPASVAPIDGLIKFSINSCAAGATVTVRVNYGTTLPKGTEYWKVDKFWYELDAVVLDGLVTRSIIEFSITDGGLGDDDGVDEPNGHIVDPGGAMIVDVFTDGFESE